VTASPPALLEALGLYAGTFLVATLSSVVPLVAIEVFLVGVAVTIAPAVAPLPALVLLAAAGQLAGKLPIYYAARGLAGLAARSARHRARLERVRAWADRRRSKPLVLATSAVLGLPPFSLAATAAGALAVPLRTFCAIVLAGRALRFAILVGIAALAS
jgi:membrane protein YqaA with SNARE-associated domain